MICLNVALFIVSAFLLLTLAVGVYFSRKKTTFREYAVGNKNFATATLVATVLATFFEGGGLVRNVECVHDLGLWFAIVLLLVPVGMWSISRFALRMGPFMQHLSMAETIESIYGKYPMVITVLVSICNCIIGVTSQIIIMSQAIGMCVTFTAPRVIPILSSLLIIFYSMFGGIRAVTFTDVLQFITFSIIIPMLCWFTFLKVGKPIVSIAPILQSYTKFQFGTLFNPLNSQLVGIVLLLLADIPAYIVDPALVQRVYMASGPIQAKKVFSYAATFIVIIQFFIILIGLFTFVGGSHFQQGEIWGYIMSHIPSPFKGFLAISLLAMAMSTADSWLNACAVMVGHDMTKSLKMKKETTDALQLKIARWTTLVLGLLAMLLAFKCRNLLKLVYWSLACTVPILTAPFILAIFGFRGTTRTALIGMFTGALSILAWNQWIAPADEVHGAFPCMLANGLAMMAAHYLLKQPERAGWVKPDDTFKQMQQEKARISAERKEAMQNSWANKKATLAKLVPSHTTMIYMGFYFCTTSLLYYFITRFTTHCSWLILHLFGSACCLGYPFLYDISKKIRAIPKWFIGLVWLVGLSVYLPLNIIWNWFYFVYPTLNLSLSLTHLSVVLLVLPLYIGIGVVAVTALLAIYPIYIGLSYPVLCFLLPLFIGSLFIFGIMIFFKVKVGKLTTQNIYLKAQEQHNASQQLKASLYEAAMLPSSGTIAPCKGYGSILKEVVRKVEESISFLDSHTHLVKEDFQSIINKFYDWVVYFNKKEKAKAHALLQPTKITLDKLIRKAEVALSEEIEDPPKLLVQKVKATNSALCPDIICDIHQVVYALVKAILRIGKRADSSSLIVKVQLHPTALQYKQADAIDKSDPVYMDFQAIALVISQSTTDAKDLPKVKACYDETPAMDPSGKKDPPPSIDLEEDTISSMIHAHYGHLAISDDAQKSTMLLVLPKDVTEILDKMTSALPTDALTIETPVTPKEQADSMMALMKFHDHICKFSCEEDAIDLKIISGLILLLRENFRFKRHASGQLFYVRAVGIAEIVVEWVFHSPKVIYAALLYELVRHTCLPLSYIKEHYNLGVYAFVSNLIKIDKREDLNDSSLLYVKNKLKKAIKEDNVQLSVLFIKLAERLYDLRHASGYMYTQEVVHMAQETLAIDVQIAHTYLEPKIGKELKKAAKQALKVRKRKATETETE